MLLNWLNNILGKKRENNISANKFLNIRDIQGNFLYTINENMVIAYLKIYPQFLGKRKIVIENRYYASDRELDKLSIKE